MAKEKIERFEDLITWQKARELTGGIYKITKLGDFSKDYGLKEQIRKASVSIMIWGTSYIPPVKRKNE